MTCYTLHFASDNASAIVRVALEELALPFRAVPVDRAAGQHKAPAYLAMNPAGRIPVLETPDGPIFETAAILLWLSDRHGGLFPAPDAPGRGAALAWLFYISNTLHPALIGVFHTERTAPGDATFDVRARLACQAAQALDVLDAQAPVALGPAPRGDTPPDARQIYLAFLMRWAALYPAGAAGWFAPGRWPRLQAMAADLEQRDSVARVALAEGLGPQTFTAPRYPTG